ncbi:MAG: hypothetical protein SGJ18_00260 [Pseudomonadota bacterium]|nr:hypothetical protein [Pseudomonadota bacterium]
MTLNFYEMGTFICLDGAAKTKGLKPSQIKVCFVTRDQKLLIDILTKLSEQPDCYFVKYSKVPKDEMFLGRCFFTAAEKAGGVWAEFKSHPKLMVHLQDDTFAANFRSR